MFNTLKRRFANRKSSGRKEYASASRRRRLRTELLEERRLLAGDVGNDQPGWDFQLSSPGYVNTYDMNVGPDGNIFLLGRFQETVDFDPGPATANLTSAAFYDGFVAKYTPAKELLWVRQISGNDDDEYGRAIDFDAAGNVYVAGQFASQSASFGAFTVANQGSFDAFLTKMDTSGNFLWVRTWGGSQWDEASGISIDSGGVVHVVGDFEETVDFDPGPGVSERSSQGILDDAFLARFNTNGDFQSVVTMGGPAYDWVDSVATDDAGNAYVAGRFEQTAQFGTSDGVTPVQLTSAGGTDGFLMKVSPTGHTDWIRQASAASSVSNSKVGYDGNGHLYFTGGFRDTLDLGPGTASLTNTNGARSDVFFSKWDTSGSLVWTGQIGGLGTDIINDMAFDSQNAPHFIGVFRETADLDPGPTIVERTSLESYDAFTLKLNPDGTFARVETVEGRAGSSFQAVAVDGPGNIYSTSYFWGTVTLPTGSVLTADDSTGDAFAGDAFVMKLTTAPGVSVSRTTGLVTGESGGAAQFDVALDLPPTADVTIDLTSSDLSEGTVSPASLTFTPANWDVPQSVTVTGVDDSVVDGDMDYAILTGAASSADPGYDGLDPADVDVTNVDDDEPPVLLYFSLTSSATLPGVGTVQDEDVVAYDGTDFEMVFDGSDVGVSGLDVDALAFLDDGSLLLSFTSAGSVGGAGSVDDSDIVRFVPAELGDNTAGSFEFYFDGSDVGLTTSGEDVDGLEVLDDGTLLISTTGSVSVSGASGSDEDLLAFTPSQLGTTTSGSWVRYFDGSDVGLSTSSSEDTNAAAVGPDSRIYVSTVGGFSVAGVSGADEDVFAFTPTTLGSSTSGTFEMFFDGSAITSVLVNADINALEIPSGPSNQAPTAVNDSYTTDEDSTLSISASGVLGNDSDGDGDPLSAQLVSGAGYGLVNLNADGSFTYVPNPNFNGSDSFSYRANDGTSDSNPATVTITVNAVNDAPAAADDSAVADEDASLEITAAVLLANDSDVDFDTLSIASVTQPSSGTLTDNGDGTYTYTPGLNFHGSDSFSYTVSDGNGGSDGATVNLTVNQVNDPGVFGGDLSANTSEDSSVGGVATFADSIDGSSSPNFSVTTNAANGSASVDASGNWSYTPNANFNGADSFVVSVVDDDGNVESQTISITVSSVTDLTAADDSFGGTEDSVLVGDVSINDSTTSGGLLSYAVDSGPSSGALSLGSGGSFTYTPGGDFNGSDSFTYVVTDATAGESATQSVSLSIGQVNDPGAFGGDLSASIDENTTAIGTVTFTDIADGSTSPGFSVSAAAASGTASIDAAGNWDYTPNLNFIGGDSFTISATDDDGNVESQVISITVNEVTELTAGNDSFNVAEDGSLVGDVSLNDSTISSGTLSFVLESGPASGSISFGSDGSFTYTPDS